MARLRLLVALLLCSTAASSEKLIYTNAPSATSSPVSGREEVGRRLTLTSAQEGKLLKKHNDLRASVNSPCSAADMETLTWDETLASESQKHAAQCVWQHDSRNSAQGWGENLAMTTNMQVDVINMVQTWYNEVADVHWTAGDTHIKSNAYTDPSSTCQSYDSDNNNCTIGQYAQVVSASTNKIGCGVAACSNGMVGLVGLYLVCKYSPQGNMQNERGTLAPYLVGKPCAACTTCSSSTDYRGKLCAVSDEPVRCKDTIATMPFMTFDGTEYTNCASLIADIPGYCGNDYDKVCKLTCNACSIQPNVGKDHCTAVSSSDILTEPSARSLQVFGVGRVAQHSASQTGSGSGSGPAPSPPPLPDSRRRRRRNRRRVAECLTCATGGDGAEAYGTDSSSKSKETFRRRRTCAAPRTESRGLCESCSHSYQCTSENIYADDDETVIVHIPKICDPYIKKCVFAANWTGSDDVLEPLDLDTTLSTEVAKLRGCHYPIAKCDPGCPDDSCSPDGTCTCSSCEMVGKDKEFKDWFAWANLRYSNHYKDVYECDCDPLVGKDCRKNGQAWVTDRVRDWNEEAGLAPYELIGNGYCLNSKSSIIEHETWWTTKYCASKCSGDADCVGYMILDATKCGIIKGFAIAEGSIRTVDSETRVFCFEKKATTAYKILVHGASCPSDSDLNEEECQEASEALGETWLTPQTHALFKTGCLLGDGGWSGKITYNVGSGTRGAYVCKKATDKSTVGLINGGASIITLAENVPTEVCNNNAKIDKWVNDTVLGGGPIAVRTHCNCQTACSQNLDCKGWTFSVGLKIVPAGLDDKGAKKGDKNCWLRTSYTKDAATEDCGGDCWSGAQGCGCSGQVDTRFGYGGTCTPDKDGQWCYVYKNLCRGEKKGIEREHKDDKEEMRWSRTPCEGMNKFDRNNPAIAKYLGKTVKNTDNCQAPFDGTRKECETCFHDDQCAYPFRCDPCIMKCVPIVVDQDGAFASECYTLHGCNSPIATCPWDAGGRTIGRWNGTSCVGTTTTAGTENDWLQCAAKDMQCAVTDINGNISDDNILSVEDGHILDGGVITKELNKDGWITWANLKKSNNGTWHERNCRRHGQVGEASRGLMRICPHIFFGAMLAMFAPRLNLS